MLPLPIEEYIPEQLKQDIDDKGQAFINKVESLIEEIRDEILELQYLKFPVRTPSEFLNVFGDYLSAGIKAGDSDAIKRRKIATAIQGHKNRGTWENDAKVRIDNITGYSAVIVTSIGTDDWILVGDGLTPSSFYWAAMGIDGIDDDLGITLLGSLDEIEIAGNTHINCHEGVTTPVLTTAQIEQIVLELDEDVVPAYFKVHLGYINGSGQFVTYDTIG